MSQPEVPKKQWAQVIERDNGIHPSSLSALHSPTHTPPEITNQKTHGTVVLIAMLTGAKSSIPVFDTLVRMVTVKGSYVGTREDTAEAADLFERGLINARVKVVGELKGVFDSMSVNKGG